MTVGAYRLMLDCIREMQPVSPRLLLEEMKGKGVSYNLTRNNLQTALYSGHISLDIDMKIVLCRPE